MECIFGAVQARSVENNIKIHLKSSLMRAIACLEGHTRACFVGLLQLLMHHLRLTNARFFITSLIYSTPVV